MKALQDADFLRSQRNFSASSKATSTASHAAVMLSLGEKEDASRRVDDLAESDILQLLTVSISVVRLFWSMKDKKVVAVKAETLREQYQKQGGLAAVACIRIIQALDSLGPDSPLDCLSEALSICKSANAIRVFVDVGMEMVPLLKQAISQNIEPEFARKLLTIIEAEEQQRQIKKEKGLPIPRTTEFLSLRELEVLQLTSTGLSNNQIAEKLIISLSTAKSHIHNITQKLGVRSRTQAIARARELKLI
jgi:LuxR family maltose regulon positive regulatory protein